jgi:hypothetical protein
MLVAMVDLMLVVSLVISIFSLISVCYIQQQDVLVRWVIMFVCCLNCVRCVRLLVALIDCCRDYFPSFTKYIIIITHIALVMCRMLS